MLCFSHSLTITSPVNNSWRVLRERANQDSSFVYSERRRRRRWQTGDPVAPAPSNDNTLTAFLSTLNGANPQPGAKATQLMSYFCKDSANPPPPKQFPSLGITDHGPAFFGQVELTNFFTQLFTTFPDMQWKDLSPRLTAPNEIGIQMNVTGSYAAQWFQHKQGTKSHFSLPLSQLPNTPGNPLGRFALDTNGLPAFAVFFFQDKTWLI
jgi:hypothetical protein